MAQPIGIVGLGLVGRALGRRLRGTGLQTIGYDRDAGASKLFTEQGGTSVASLADMSTQADCVVLAVFDTQGVLETLEGASGLLAQARHPQVVVDCSTGSPELLVDLATRLDQRGVAFVEAPLSGSSEQIAAGEAVALVGASDAAYAMASPLLALVAKECVHVGAAGMGAKAKLATNLVLGLNRAVFAEGLAFAESLGIAPEQFLALTLATPARSEAAAIKGPLMVAGDFTPRSRIRQHLKDVQLMLQGASAQGLALPFSQVHAALLAEAVAQDRGELDNAAIVLQLRKRKAPLA